MKRPHAAAVAGRQHGPCSSQQRGGGGPPPWHVASQGTCRIQAGALWGVTCCCQSAFHDFASGSSVCYASRLRFQISSADSVLGALDSATANTSRHRRSHTPLHTLLPFRRPPSSWPVLRAFLCTLLWMPTPGAAGDGLSTRGRTHEPGLGRQTLSSSASACVCNCLKG